MDPLVRSTIDHDVMLGGAKLESKSVSSNAGHAPSARLGILRVLSLPNSYGMSPWEARVAECIHLQIPESWRGIFVSLTSYLSNRGGNEK